MSSALNRPTGLSVAILFALTAGSVAYAQSDAADQAQAKALDDIEVTAQRRATPLQKTPIAITALTAKDFEQKQINRLDDLRGTLPNVIIEQNTGTSSGAKIFLRGVGADESLFTSDPAVAIYIDDVYIPRQTGSQIALYDIERIEVLRGPQGTLYGRNATGGAIRYITKKPSGQPSIRIDGTVGNMGRADLRGTWSTAFSDQVSAQFALMTRNRDGYIENTDTSTPTRPFVSDVNDQEVNAGRGSLSWDISDATSANFAIDFVRERSGPVYATGVIRAPIIVSPTVTRPVNDPDRNYYTSQSNIAGPKNDLDQFGASVVVEHNFGGLLWRNILAYREMQNLLFGDFDGSAQTRLHLFQDQDQKQHSFESQLTSQGDSKLQWTTGFFYFYEDNFQPTRQDVFGPGVRNDIAQEVDAYALYGQMKYALADDLNLTFGLRFSRETKQFSVDSFLPTGAPNSGFTRSAAGVDFCALLRTFERCSGNGAALKDTFREPDKRIAIDYALTDNVFGYASYSSGFKSGGFNGRGGNASLLSTVSEETVDSTEFGFKTDWLDRRLRFNANFYHNEYDGLQLTAIDPASGFFVLINAADTRIQGFEAELTAVPTEGLTLYGNAGTIDGEYSNVKRAGVPVVCAAAGGAQIDRNECDFFGKKLKQAPELTYNLGGSYVHPFLSGNLTWSTNWHFTGRHFQNFANSTVIETRGYHLLDARIAYTPNNGPWSVALVGKNLDDTEYFAGGFDIAGLGIAAAYMNVPRQVGLEFSYTFE
jgi:iron complex outermembrane recepter protein